MRNEEIDDTWKLKRSFRHWRTLTETIPFLIALWEEF